MISGKIPSVEMMDESNMIPGVNWASVVCQCGYGMCYLCSLNANPTLVVNPKGTAACQWTLHPRQ